MSPIVISLSRDGYHLTSASNGVAFDLTADGVSEQTAWTAAESDDVFLVMDRNANGRVDDGKELFGSYTDQPYSPFPNGFLALSVFDTPERGGNGNGYIDSGDAVFSELRLWRDSNHNGFSEPSELFTLPELGIYNISLTFQRSHRTDEHGNKFRYRAKVNDGLISSASRWAYDVIFVTQ